MQLKKSIILLATIFMVVCVQAQTVVLEISQAETPARKATITAGQSDIVFLQFRLTAQTNFQATGLHIPLDMSDKYVGSFTNFHLNVNGEYWANAELHSQGYFLELHRDIQMDSLDHWDIQVIGDVTSDAINDGFIKVNADKNMFMEPQWDTLSISNGIITGEATGTSFRVDAIAENTMTLSCNNCVDVIELEPGVTSVENAHRAFITNGTRPCNLTMLMYQIYPAEFILPGMQAQLYVDGAPLGTPKWVDASNQIIFNETIYLAAGQPREITVELLGTGSFNGVLQIGLFGTAFSEEYTGYALKWNGEFMNKSNPMLGPSISIGGSYTSRLRCNNCLSAQTLIPNNYDGVKVLRFFVTNTGVAGTKSGFVFSLDADSLDFSGWRGTVMASRPTYPGSEDFYYDFFGGANIAADGSCVIQSAENAELAMTFEVGETKEMFLRLNRSGGPNAEFGIYKEVTLTCSLLEIQGESTEWNGRELSASDPFVGPEITLVPQIDATIFCDNCLEDQHFEILPNQLDAIKVSIKNHSTSKYTLQNIDFAGTSEGDSIYFDQWHAQLLVNKELTSPLIQIDWAGVFHFNNLGIEISPGETKEFILQVEPPKTVGQGLFRFGVSNLFGETESSVEGGGKIDIFWNGAKLSEKNQFMGPILSFDATGYLVEEEDTVFSEKSASLPHLKSVALAEDEAIEVLKFFIENGDNNAPLTDFSIEIIDTLGGNGSMLGSNVWVQLYVDDEPVGSKERMYNSLRIGETVPFDSMQTRKFSIFATGLTKKEANRLFVVTQIRGGFNIVWDKQELSPFNPYYGPIISAITAVDAPPQNSDISVYPNPVTNRICLEGLQETIKYSVYSLAGQMIQSGEVETEINCQDWQPGMYILFINATQGVINKSIIKL